MKVIQIFLTLELLFRALLILVVCLLIIIVANGTYSHDVRHTHHLNLLGPLLLKPINNNDGNNS